MYKRQFELGNKEYLTETQDIENGGPLLVDIDMRFAEEIIERQIDDEEIVGIIELYCEAIKDLFEFNEEIEFPVYVFQKDNVVIQEGKETKDGLHLVFGIQMKHDIQQVLRNIVIQKEKDEM